MASGPGCLGRILRFAAAVAAVVLIAGAAAAYWLYEDYQNFKNRPILASGQVVSLEIPRGTSWPGVVERVEAAELVEWAPYFDLWGRQTGVASAVKAGNFVLEGPMDLEELEKLLRQGGRAEAVTITFREGLTIFNLADIFAEAGLGTRQEFIDVAKKPSRYDELGGEVETLEGYLYPETYQFRAEVGAEEVVDKLVDQWRQKIAPLFDEYGPSLQELQDRYDMDRHDVIIMASLIERESSVASERPKIARVFYNRLDRGMQLQTDPTCVYGESTYRDVPSPGACRDPLNRYSTYVIEGLPPGPIASPTASSVEAALNPSQDPEAAEYLYFVARRDGTGGHHFSKSYAEHRRAIDRYLRD